MAMAKAMFNAFKLAWIDIYLGLLDFVVYNYKTNFNSEEFRILLRSVRSTFKLISVEAYHLIGKVKRYYRPLRRAYEIVTEKPPKLSDANRLQMAVKVINNTIESNRLIPTLFVFGAYLKITELNLPNPIVKQRAAIIKRAMKKIRKIQATRKVNKALRIRNGPSIIHVYDFFLNDLILMYREKKGWRGPYKFLGIKGKIIKALIDNNLICTFKSTFIRLFKIDNFSIKQKKEKLLKDLLSTLIIVPNEEP